MSELDLIQKELLEQVADLHGVPAGAYNIRANGASAARNTTANIDIVTKEDKQGIDIIIKPGTKNESVHIPVVLSQSGLTEVVYNDFYIGDDCDVTIVAGCGIHNGGGSLTKHDGVHTFYVGKNARIRYVEKHYGSGEGTGEKIMNAGRGCHLTGRTGREVAVQLRGGTLDIRWDERTGHVLMTGPARTVFSGEYSPAQGQED